MVFKTVAERAIGPGMAAVLPQDNIPWYRKPNLLRLNIHLFFLFLFSSANGYDGSMMNGLQALPQWQTFMNTPVGAWLGFINAAQSLGAFCLFPIVAYSNNRFGRKRTIAVGYFWLALGASLQTAAQNEAMFIIGRICIGGVSAFFSASVPVLMTEIAYPTHRGVLTAFYNTGWYVGSLVAAWATYGTRTYADSWAWRIPSLLQICIPVFAFAGFFSAPESPRWLASVGRTEEAREFLVKYHSGGDEHSPLVAFELEEITKTLQMEHEIAASTSWLDLFKTPGRRHRAFITITLGVFAQWNGVGIASYYLAPVLKTVGVTSVTNQTMISGFLQVWNLIIAVSAAFTVDKAGRRLLFMISCLGMLLSYVFIAALSGSFAHTHHAATGIAVIPFLFIYYGFYDIAFTPLIVSYTCEIWPYTYRARGLAMGQISTQLAIFFNVFVNPIALNAIAWKYYVIYVILLVIITAVIYFFYPETNGHSLEEMVKVFDGENAVVAEEPHVLVDEKKILESTHSQNDELRESNSKTEPSAHVESLSNA